MDAVIRQPPLSRRPRSRTGGAPRGRRIRVDVSEGDGEVDRRPPMAVRCHRIARASGNTGDEARRAPPFGQPPARGLRMDAVRPFHVKHHAARDGRQLKRQYPRGAERRPPGLLRRESVASDRSHRSRASSRPVHGVSRSPAWGPRSGSRSWADDRSKHLVSHGHSVTSSQALFAFPGAWTPPPPSRPTTRTRSHPWSTAPRPGLPDTPRAYGAGDAVLCTHFA